MVPTAPSNFSKTHNFILHELIHLNAAYQEPRNVLTAAIPYIKTPKLQRLSFRHAWMDDEHYADLANLVARSGCAPSAIELMLLWWLETPVPTPGFPLLLRQLSDVEHLVITDGGMVSRDWNDELNLIFLRLLLPTKQSPMLLPKLKSLELVDLNFDPALLINVVESRSQPPLANGAEQTSVVPLERVEVSYFARSSRSEE